MIAIYLMAHHHHVINIPDGQRREKTYTRIGQVSQCVTLRFDGHNFDINGPGGCYYYYYYYNIYSIIVASLHGRAIIHHRREREREI